MVKGLSPVTRNLCCQSARRNRSGAVIPPPQTDSRIQSAIAKRFTVWFLVVYMLFTEGGGGGGGVCVCVFVRVCVWWWWWWWGSMQIFRLAIYGTPILKTVTVISLQCFNLVKYTTRCFVENASLRAVYISQITRNLYQNLSQNAQEVNIW